MSLIWGIAVFGRLEQALRATSEIWICIRIYHEADIAISTPSVKLYK